MFLLDPEHFLVSVQSTASDLLRNSIVPGVLPLQSYGGNHTTDLWCALGQQVLTTVGKRTNKASGSDQCLK